MRAGSVRLRIEPSPLRTSSSLALKSGRSVICCSFSCNVIRASSWLTLVSIDRSAGWRAGCNAASSLDRVPATTPPAAAPVTATTTAAIAALRLSMEIDLPVRRTDGPATLRDRCSDYAAPGATSPAS
jgi:hypothetical protein